MKPLHIAIFAGMSKAHVYPVLGFCPELIKRGYRVTFATDSRHASMVRQAGAEPVVFDAVKFEVPEDLRKSLNMDSIFKLDPQHPDWWVLFARVVHPWDIRTAEAIVSQLGDFYSNNVPDVILYDHPSFAGRIFSKRLNRRAIQIHPHFAYAGKFKNWKNGVGCTPEPLLEFSEALDLFLQPYGIEESGNLWRTEGLNICLIPKAFQYHADLFDDRFCFVGCCLSRPFVPVWKNRSQGKPIILITDTTDSGDYDYFNAFIDGLSGSKYHVILSISEQISNDRLKTLPANFEVSRHASHLELLPHTSLLLCQAGMGGTLEAIYHGLPIIAMPLIPHHEEIAYRVAELGLGIHLPRHSITTGVVRDSVERVLGDIALRNRVKDMQCLFKRSGGAVMVADKIEEFLGVRQAT